MTIRLNVWDHLSQRNKIMPRLMIERTTPGLQILFSTYWANQLKSGRCFSVLIFKKMYFFLGCTGYYIPYGGLFELITCPNYFGELVEWLGWSLATWSPAGLVWALFSAATFIPRSWHNHNWYVILLDSVLFYSLLCQGCLWLGVGPIA